MEKNGYRRKQSQTLLELATAIMTTDSVLKNNAVIFVEKYHQFEYGKASEKELEVMFKNLENDFRESRSYPS